MYKDKGFTLVEISIVIIIIGLLLGGVLAGQNIIHQSKLKLIASDLRKYESAILSFREKFKYYPGDFGDATDYWSTAADGNGNWIIETSTSATEEFLAAWEHLVLAKMLEGAYDGTNPPIANKNVPDAGEFGYFGLGHFPSYFARASNEANAITLAKVKSSQLGCGWCNSALSSKDANNIDRKLDDGVANTGNLFAVDGEDASAGACSAAYDNGSGSDYDLTTSTISCRIFYWLE